MNRIFTALAIISLASLVAAPVASAGQAPPARHSSSSSDWFAKGNDIFAAQLYGELANKPGNLFFSPYSIRTALGMTYAGARGDTAKEMKQVLHFQSDRARVNETFKTVGKKLMALAKKDAIKLNIANGLYFSRGGVNKAFETVLKEDYNAELFSGGLEQINAWVRQKTEGKIRKILSQLSPNSVCVILNAIYFKGAWQSQFSKRNTRKAPFFVSSTKRVKTPFMYQRDQLKILEAKDFQAASIPYKGDDFSMVILLPRTTEGLAGLEKRLTAAKLGEWLKRVDMQPTRRTMLYVPKFRMNTSYNLKSSLMKMGMNKAFEQNADFSGIKAPKGTFWIGKVKHKGFLQVNERGTEAAAATGVVMTATAVPMRNYLVFRADHPFLFLIRDNRNGIILFMGRLDDPTIFRRD